MAEHQSNEELEVSTESTASSEERVSTRSIIAQVISLGIHLLLLVAFVAWGQLSSARDKLIPADVDVIEFELPQQAAGPVDAPPDEIDLGPAEQIESESVIQPDIPEVPQIDLPIPEAVSEESPLPKVNLEERQQQLAEIDVLLDKLRENVSRSGGGDDASDPDSRGRQQARWTILFDSTQCRGFGQQLLDIGIQEIAVVGNNDLLTYVDPLSLATHRGSISDENRMYWVASDGKRIPCFVDLAVRAGLHSTTVIGFMSIEGEQECKRAEAKYAGDHGIDIASIRSTVFTPTQSGGQWTVVVSYMR